MSDLAELARLVRYYILISTTEAGSGHPSSSLSATDLMTALFFRYFRYDLDRPDYPTNDRLIFSKGHAAPLLYALYTAAGAVKEDELRELRRLGSVLQGHPTPQFRYAEAATGSLGQGLSMGVGAALNAKYEELPYRTFVLLGDGEMAEGSVWEAIQIATHYHLDNLIAFVDVNRLGQSQQTMYGHDVQAYVQRIAAFGWDVVAVDGHSLDEIDKALARFLNDPAFSKNGRPKAIVGKTLKGKGISFLEDKDGWHGKALSQSDLEKALKEIQPIPQGKKGTPPLPPPCQPKETPCLRAEPPVYKKGELVATRKAYGTALLRLAPQCPDVVALDGDVKNSTFAEILAQKYPKRFFEMFIAEQNMVGVAVGLAGRGKIPFASSFAAFLTRAYDQIRMAAVTGVSIKCVGSHVGVSIGEDGPSQMGLEDIAMFRALHGSTVLYPSDAVSTEYLVEEAIRTPGIVYIRTSRPATPVLYDVGEEFPVGGSKVLRSSSADQVTLVAAGITVLEALTAYDELKKKGVTARVIDCYSVKPIDRQTLEKAAQETRALFVVEDHWWEGGLGDAVLDALAEKPLRPVYKLAVKRLPGSGKPAELVDQAGISARAIIEKVQKVLSS